MVSLNTSRCPFDGLHMRPNGTSDPTRTPSGRSTASWSRHETPQHDDDPEIVELWQELGIPVAMVLEWGQWWSINRGTRLLNSPPVTGGND